MTEIELVRLADRIVPILGFVLCISVVAELADRIGVLRFSLIASRFLLTDRCGDCGYLLSSWRPSRRWCSRWIPRQCW